MTINELSQYYYLSKEIQKDKYRIVELRSKAEKITVSTLGFPLSKTENSKVEKGVIAIADIEEIIKLNIQKRYYEEKRIREYIDNIDDAKLRLAFKTRFIDMESWVKVAMVLGGNNTADGARMMIKRYIEKK